MNPLSEEYGWSHDPPLPNPDSVAAIYRQFFPRVYAYVAYHTATRQDCEDIVSETFLRAVERLTQFEDRGEGSLAAWLFRIAHNLIVDAHRRQRQRGMAVHLDALPWLRAHDLQPEQAAAQHEAIARLRAALATLSPRQREVITLRFFGDLRNRDIARVLGIAERSVAAYLSRGTDELYRLCRGEETSDVPGSRKGRGVGER